MSEVFRIKKGELTSGDLAIPIDFGLVFEDDGHFSLDTYVSESYPFLDFLNKDENKLFDREFSLSAVTDEYNKFIASRLYVSGANSHQLKIVLQCYGYISHTVVQNEQEAENDDDETPPVIYYLELEGLKFKFSEYTQITRTREGVTYDEIFGRSRDYTPALLMYNGSALPIANHFPLIFHKHPDNDNIIVKFPNFIENGNGMLPYRAFQEFKQDFVSLLSLLNGAEVAIRREYIGGYYKIDDIDSQTHITYSYKKLKNIRYNKYVPIDMLESIHKNIINHVFMNCFDNYVRVNKDLDLNMIIFYLNGSQQLRSLEEKFFIQIIAFERLAQKYIDLHSQQDFLLVPEDVFAPIKRELLSVIKKYEKDLGEKLNQIKGKIGDLHRTKRTSTEFKFIKLLEYANITITADIQHIIDVARHKSIHHGEIGEGHQSVRNSLVLDTLLRDIILNLIGYSSYRFNPLRIQTEDKKLSE